MHAKKSHLTRYIWSPAPLNNWTEARIMYSACQHNGVSFRKLQETCFARKWTWLLKTLKRDRKYTNFNFFLCFIELWWHSKKSTDPIKRVFLLWEKIVLVLLQNCVYSTVCLFHSYQISRKESWGGENAGLPPLDNALPYQGRLLSGFLSQALALLLQRRTGVQERDRWGLKMRTPKTTTILLQLTPRWILTRTLHISKPGINCFTNLGNFFLS